jgi:hypothetical protein
MSAVTVGLGDEAGAICSLRAFPLMTDVVEKVAANKL